MECTNHHFRLIKNISGGGKIFKWFELGSVLIWEERSIPGTNFWWIQMWKCMLVDSMKYPLLSRWYDSQIYWESAPTCRTNSNYKQFLFLLICAWPNTYKVKEDKLYVLIEVRQFGYIQIVEHAFLCTHSLTVQSKKQTSGYIDTNLIILFVPIDTCSIILVSLWKSKSSLRSWIFSSRSKEHGKTHKCNPFPADPLNTPIILYRFYAQHKIFDIKAERKFK